MQFRWVIAITLWTILSGPVFAPPPSALQPGRERAVAANSATPVKASVQAVRR